MRALARVRLRTGYLSLVASVAEKLGRTAPAPATVASAVEECGRGADLALSSHFQWVSPESAGR